jgi:hypothetical protein
MVRTSMIGPAVVASMIVLSGCGEDRWAEELGCAEAAVYIREPRFEDCVPVVGIRRFVTETCEPGGATLSGTVEPPLGGVYYVHLRGVTPTAWYEEPATNFHLQIGLGALHESIDPCAFRVTRRGSNTFDEVQAELSEHCAFTRLDPPDPINTIEVDEIVFRAPLLPYRAEDVPAGCEHLLDE